MMRRHVAVVIGAVIAVVLQIIVAPNIAIASIVPDFLLAYVVVYSVVMARTCGLVMPFILGLIFDFIGGGPIGAEALVFVLISFVLSRVFPALDNDTLFMSLVTIIISVFLCEIVYGIFVILCGMSVGVIDALIYRSLPCALYACVFALIMYPLVVRFVAGRSSRQPKMPLIS